jgi:hypothetical protein
MMVLFEILISLFERAYLTAYSDRMTAQQRRRWHSWDDFMREWCGRTDFRMTLPFLLQGEDPDFAAYIRQLAEEESVNCVEDCLLGAVATPHVQVENAPPHDTRNGL